MKLRRHIAFFAVLVATAVMFAHAVVPHHHRASDLAVCTEVQQEICSHILPDGTAVRDADCDCNCNGVKCAPPLPFTLRYGMDGDDRSSMQEGPLPLFVCDHCTGYYDLSIAADLSAGSSAASYFLADTRLTSQWEPGSASGRAPPVL